jgi:hypothetical protein
MSFAEFDRRSTRPRHVAGIAVAAALGLCGVARAAEPPAPLAALAGEWACAGHFVPSNRPIASTISIRRDAPTGALIVRHDDLAPAAYHALEIWTAQPDHGFRAAISDGYTGMRWFASEAWAGDVLTWTRPEQGPPTERFAYTLEPGGTLRVDWSVARAGAPLTLGDTLVCHKA